jgi:hypothetical protein
VVDVGMGEQDLLERDAQACHLGLQARQIATRVDGPAADTWLTGRMRQAGLNLMGRTTTPEFGVCSSAENPAVYITRNPWNTGLHHLRLVGRQRGDGGRRRGADGARHRRRRVHPHSRPASTATSV